MKTLEAKVTETSTGRVDRVVQSLTEFSRSQIRGLFDHNCIHVNGVPCGDPGLTVQINDLVTVTYDPHTRYREKKERWTDRTFSIVYDDDDIVVVNKTAGVLTVATERGEDNTLAQRVGVYLSHGRKRRVAGVVHRLDREVSGLLVMAKHEKARTRLVEQFKEHKPDRHYSGLVHGNLAKPSGTIRNFLMTAKNLDRFATTDEQAGELAITHYQVTETFDRASLVDVQLETGRRNQIRVHLADLGHPLLGDERYGRHTPPHPKWTARRIALHASTLAFIHPASGKKVAFESPLPSVLQRFINAAKKLPSGP